MKRRVKLCQYGLNTEFTAPCSQPAVTIRARPNGKAFWDVCKRHAEALDRLRENLIEHEALLERLKEGEV